MIEEHACVEAVEPGFAWVASARKSACGNCAASSGCGTSVVAKLFGERVNRFQVADAVGVQVGEWVVIGIADGTVTRASLIAYLLPLLALMLVAFLAQSAGVGEGLSALLGILGLCAGLWITGRLVGGAAGRERYRPAVLRRVEPARTSALVFCPGPEPLSRDYERKPARVSPAGCDHEVSR